MKKSASIQELKTVVTYSTLGLGTATGFVMLVRYFYKKAQKVNADKGSMNEGDPSAFARQFKMAFENDNWMGWGTNVTLVRQVFTQIPTKAAYAKVQKAYAALYNQTLNTDLQSELSSSEYNEMILILASKKK